MNRILVALMCQYLDYGLLHISLHSEHMYKNRKLSYSTIQYTVCQYALKYGTCRQTKLDIINIAKFAIFYFSKIMFPASGCCNTVKQTTQSGSFFFNKSASNPYYVSVDYPGIIMQYK